MTARDYWDTRFAATDYVFGTQPSNFLTRQAELLTAGQTALAVADGEGRNGVWLAEQGLDVTSMDFSEAALEKARKLAASRAVEVKFERADLTDWSWPPEAFDIVAAVFIQFADAGLREKIFAGIRRTLKPGGLLLLHGYRPEQLAYKTGGPSTVENLYTRELLERSFGDWQILLLREYDQMLTEGAGHAGMSALVDLVARKPANG